MNLEDKNQLQVPEETQTKVPVLGSSQDFIYFYTHCSYCGSHLHFTHVTDFGKNLTHESAKCPECGIQAIKQLHSLQ